MRTSTSRYRLRPTMVNKFIQLFQINVFLSIRWPCATIFVQSRSRLPFQCARTGRDCLHVDGRHFRFAQLSHLCRTRAVACIDINCLCSIKQHFLQFLFLPPDSGGNCSDQWQVGYKTASVKYSATNCEALCRQQCC